MNDKPVFSVRSELLKCVQEKDLVGDHLVSQDEKMKMALLPANAVMRDRKLVMLFVSGISERQVKPNPA